MTVHAFDFETALIQPGLNAPPPVCMSVAKGSDAWIYAAEEGLDTLESLLRDSSVLLVGAATSFDMAVACAARPSLIPFVFDAYDADRVTDVLIRQKLIDIAMGVYRMRGKYTLAGLAHRLLDLHLEKEDTWRLRYWELVDTPISEWPDAAISYSLDDSKVTLRVYDQQTDGLLEVDKIAVLDDEYRQARADFALRLASVWGLRTDREGVARLREACETRQAEIQAELLNAGLLRVKKVKGVETISRCVRVAQQRMLDVNPNARLTKKGAELKCREAKYISVDQEACEDSGDPVLEKYTEFSQLTSLLSGHVKAMEEGVDTPIHTFFEVLLETGRTSSSRPNVQNVRRAPGARECFRPREGYVYVGCDIDRAELHTLGQVCINLFGKSQLADTLNAGIDPHTRLGARLAHMNYEDLKALIDAGDETAAEWRQRAKPANFGFPGGMGAPGMVRYAKSTYGVIIGMSEAEHLYEGWQAEYPDVSQDYLGWIRSMTSATGFTTIEHFDSHRWRGHVPYCAAANSFFQGMAADALKAALWAVTRKCYVPGTALYGSRVVNEIHDELLLETPADRVSEAAWETQRTMVDAYNQWTRDVPVNATPVAMDRWSKKAKPIVEDGVLKVWRYQGG